jgi:hypothetical protein
MNFVDVNVKNPILDENCLNMGLYVSENLTFKAILYG